MVNPFVIVGLGFFLLITLVVNDDETLSTEKH